MFSQIELYNSIYHNPNDSEDEYLHNVGTIVDFIEKECGMQLLYNLSFREVHQHLFNRRIYNIYKNAIQEFETKKDYLVHECNFSELYKILIFQMT